MATTNQAYLEGFAARTGGLSCMCNPYLGCGDLWYSWNNGWQAAKTQELVETDDESMEGWLDTGKAAG